MAANKVSHDSDYLDFSKLEKEVQTAVVSEERYWRENDAKIRAVEQRVPTYDDFREMVLAAHLKPLEKKDKLSSIQKFTQVWNQAAHKLSSSPHGIQDQATRNVEQKIPENSNTDKESLQKLPGSGREFQQHWRQYCKTHTERKQLLFTFGAPALSEIFKVEITGDLLGEFLECLICFDNSEAGLVMEILEALAKSQRFSLSLAFLSKKEEDSIRCLFEALKRCPFVNDSSLVMEKLAKLEFVYNKH